jgi:hypothetical protein
VFADVAPKVLSGWRAQAAVEFLVAPAGAPKFG